MSAIPASATTSPTSAAVSSNSTISTAGSRASLIVRRRLRPRLIFFLQLAIGRAEGQALEEDRAAQDDVGPARVAGVGIAPRDELVNPLVDGVGRAHAEHGQRDDEAPEVLLGAVAELVARVGGPLRAPDPQEQEELVPRVGARVRELREHGGRAREQRGHELEHGDAQVGSQGRDDDLEAALLVVLVGLVTHRGSLSR